MYSPTKDDYVRLIRAFVDAIEPCGDISDAYIDSMWGMFASGKCTAVISYYDTLSAIINSMIGCFANRVSFSTVVAHAVGVGNSVEQDMRRQEAWQRGGGTQYNDSVFDSQNLAKGQSKNTAYSSSFDVARSSTNDLSYYRDSGFGNGVRQSVADSYAFSTGFSQQSSSAQDKFLRTGNGTTCSFARDERRTTGQGIPAIIFAFSLEDTQTLSAKHYRTSDRSDYKRDASDQDLRHAESRSQENAKSRLSSFSNFQAVVDFANSSVSQGFRISEGRGSRDSFAYQLSTGYSQGDAKGNAQSTVTGRDALDGLKSISKHYTYDGIRTITAEKSRQLVQHLKDLQKIMFTRRKDIQSKSLALLPSIVGKYDFSTCQLRNTRKTLLVPIDSYCCCFACAESCDCGKNWGAFVLYDNK